MSAPVERASLIDIARLREAGLSVERWGSGWTLRDRNDPVNADGDALCIAGHGCVSPTQWEAVAEGLRRIERGDYGEPPKAGTS